MLFRTIRHLWMLLALLVSLVVGVINLRLYVTPLSSDGPPQIAPEVIPQLRFLRTALDRGAGERMQQLFPEGFVFTHVLYGLTWVEVGLREPAHTALREQALSEARWALHQLDLPAARAPFTGELKPLHGVFYVGWSSWLRGGSLLLEPGDAGNPEQRARFEADCAALASAFEQSPTPFLSAYPGQAWPVDSTVAIAALQLHDRVGPPRFRRVVERWIAAARERLDGATGLLPHRADPQKGYVLEGARGSSQSLIARFLPEIDAAWATEQYGRFRRQYIASPLGIPGVREYPPGVQGVGDIDSGPLIFGVSPSATVVTLGAALTHGDRELGGAILQSCEALGLPIKIHGTKRYALGQLPVGDAFLAWAKTSVQRTSPQKAPQWPAITSWWWRLPFHGVSLLLITLLWWPAWVWRRRERRMRSTRQIGRLAAR